MKKQTVIGVDVDGVLADFMHGVRAIVKRHFKHHADIDMVLQTTFGLDSIGLTDEEQQIIWDEIHETPNFWAHLPSLPGTSLLKPIFETYDVHFITNRFETGGIPADVQTAMWLKEHFHIDAIGHVHPSSDKSVEARKLGLDYMIDDKPSNLTDVLRGAPNCRVILQSATYNREARGVPRVFSFNEFAALIGGK